MKCVICKNGTTRKGRSTVTLEKDGTTVVFKNVPAQICTNCGHAYFDSDTTKRLLR